LSRNGRFVAVVDVIVMSPRALIVYTRPEENDTPALAIRFVVDPAARVLRSYTPFGKETKAPPFLYAIASPIGTSAPVVVFFAYMTIAFAFALAFTKRTYASEKSIAAE
jgi:hypothetical protein